MVVTAIEVPATTLSRVGGEAAAEALAARAANACQAVLEAEGHGDWELSLTLVSSQRCRALNRAYRGVDRATDVLSFSQREGEALAAGAAGEGERLLGDVVVALPVAIRQAQAFGHSVQREVAFLAVHGTLHLLGYDHQTPPDEAAMMGKAENVLGRLGLTRDG
jgi:probable rRNA maturation factor